MTATIGWATVGLTEGYQRIRTCGPCYEDLEIVLRNPIIRTRSGLKTPLKEAHVGKYELILGLVVMDLFSCFCVTKDDN